MVWDIIKKMDLELIQGEVPKHLSFGQCQKAALAKALVKKPQILIFDEPLSNIDASAKNEYKKLIVEAKKLLPQCTFFYVTHNINDAMELSNKIMVIDSGKILQFDEKQILFENPANTQVASYILPIYEKYLGKIKDGYFISEEKKIKLTEFQDLTLNRGKCDNAICYSLNDINIFFDNEGNLLAGYIENYNFPLYIKENKLEILNNQYDINMLNDAIIKKEDIIAILDRKKFSLSNIENSIKFKGNIVYINNEIFAVKVDGYVIPFSNSSKYKIGDNIEIYYPIDELRGINKNGEKMISSYVISDNKIEIKVLNSKKGLIKIGKIKIIDPVFIGMEGIVHYKISLNDIIITPTGKFKIDVLYNEEKLGKENLIHFSCRNINDYMSAIVSNLNLFNVQKITFDIKFSNLTNLK
jgi:ABC-type proline/glycine betaine transport system ATPase subunit